jgi:pimeloyl-ACP methyl ester carboxylesterase
LGGYVGLALAEHYPQYLKKLCLFNSTALPDSEAKKRTRNHTTFFVQKNGVKPFAEDFSAMMFFAGRKEELHNEIEYIKESVKNTPETSILQCTIALRDRPDRTSILPKLNFPVMYIIGRDDASIPFETYEKQVFLPKNCIIHILENTGHVGMLERPKETLKMVLDFL